MSVLCLQDNSGEEKRVKDFAKVIGAIFVAIGIIIVFPLIFALPVKWLWNAVVPDIFGLKEISWKQALWLSLLCSMLFKSYSSKRSD